MDRGWGLRSFDIIVVLVALTLGAVVMAACGGEEPTAPPTAVVNVASATPLAERDTATPPPTETATPLPTDTPPLATDTALPPTMTATPAPSDTPILPTDTPPPTDTPVPPTDTPEPPTATAAPPTNTPRPPTATAPPAPQFPWRGQVTNTFSNCALTRLMGLTLDRNGGIAGGLWVHYWADGWEGAWAPSSWSVNEGYEGLDDSSNWDGILATYAKPGRWFVCVVPAEGSRDCISNTVTAETVAEPCDPDTGAQIVRIVFQQN